MYMGFWIWCVGWSLLIRFIICIIGVDIPTALGGACIIWNFKAEMYKAKGRMLICTVLVLPCGITEDMT